MSAADASRNLGQGVRPSAAWLAALTEAFPDPIVVIDVEGALLWANRAAERRLGRRLDEWVGESVIGLVHPDDTETALVALASVQSTKVGTVLELRVRDRTGRYSRFEMRGALVHHEHGPTAIVLSLRDSTARHRWHIAHGDAELLGSIVDATDSVMMLLGEDGTIRGANRSLTRSVRRSLQSTIGSNFVDLVAPDDRARVASELVAASRADRRSFEARLITPEGSSVPYSLTVVNLLDDRAVKGLVLSGVDISSLVEVRSRLQHLATHDDLTGLPNRAAFRAHLEAVLAADPHAGYSVVFADVDSLKPINDTYGHPAGDVVLSVVGQRLRRAVRPDDLVARVGGDEFAIVTSTADPRVVARLEGRIAHSMAAPIALPDGTAVTVSVTTGGATVSDRPVSDVLAAADTAMYRTKRARHRLT